MDKATFERIGRESFTRACGDVRFDRIAWLNVRWFTTDGPQTLGYCLTVGPVANQRRTIGPWDHLPVDDHKEAMVQRSISVLSLGQIIAPVQAVETLFDTMVQEIRPIVCELDHRIGTLWEGVDGPNPLPACPLFDPPRFVFPAWEQVPGVQAQPCPFCHQVFTPSQSPMWGGGDLRWVHPACWIR